MYFQLHWTVAPGFKPNKKYQVDGFRNSKLFISFKLKSADWRISLREKKEVKNFNDRKRDVINIPTKEREVRAVRLEHGLKLNY